MVAVEGQRRYIVCARSLDLALDYNNHAATYGSIGSPLNRLGAVAPLACVAGQLRKAQLNKYPPVLQSWLRQSEPSFPKPLPHEDIDTGLWIWTLKPYIRWR